MTCFRKPELTTKNQMIDKGIPKNGKKHKQRSKGRKRGVNL